MSQREKALEILQQYLKTEHLVKHSYAVEVVMKALAKKLDPQNEEDWALAGLLHDVDLDTLESENTPQFHGLKAIEILKDHGFGNEKIYHAISAHNKDTGVKAESIMDQAICAADPITGFITAITLVYPDKKISSVKVKSITKRMKEVRFAAGADREAMKSIENLGISFEEFAELSLQAMNEIADQLGL